MRHEREALFPNVKWEVLQEARAHLLGLSLEHSHSQVPTQLPEQALFLWLSSVKLQTQYLLLACMSVRPLPLATG